MFYDYLQQEDFVGADMAKKFLHMGYTRSRRYANHKDGKKWTNINGEWKILIQESDAMTSEKAKCAEVFKAAWFEAKDNVKYLKMKKHWRNK
mgnify:CR=1 FL=1